MYTIYINTDACNTQRVHTHTHTHNQFIQFSIYICAVQYISKHVIYYTHNDINVTHTIINTSLHNIVGRW